MSSCLRSALDERPTPYLKGVVGRIASADEHHIAYPVRIKACDEWVTFRFETAQEFRGGTDYRTFLEETAGTPSQVVSGDVAVVPVDSALGDHVLATDSSGDWGILPVPHAEHFSKPRTRQLLASKLRGEPSTRP